MEWTVCGFWTDFLFCKLHLKHYRASFFWFSPSFWENFDYNLESWWGKLDFSRIWEIFIFSFLLSDAANDLFVKISMKKNSVESVSAPLHLTKFAIAIMKTQTIAKTHCQQHPQNLCTLDANLMKIKFFPKNKSTDKILSKL